MAKIYFCILGVSFEIYNYDKGLNLTRLADANRRLANKKELVKVFSSRMIDGKIIKETDTILDEYKLWQK